MSSLISRCLGRCAVALALLVMVAGCATTRETIAKLTPYGDKWDAQNEWGELALDWQNTDFSWIRGANYVPSYARNDVETWENFSPRTIDRELGYAASVGINSVRVFLQIICYEKDPETFLENFETFLQLCDKHNITMMPVLFDSCFGTEPSFEARGWVACPGNTRVSQETWPGCEKYLDDVVGRHIGDPRIAVWDLMNEPMVAGTFTHTQEGRDKVFRFLTHMIAYVNELDPTHATTSGHASDQCWEVTGDLTRVLSVHYYSGDPEIHAEAVKKGKDMANAMGKGLIVSELGHYGLDQSYRMALEEVRKNDAGWYIWELMIARSPFATVQGIFYPDGSIRSTDDYCAVLGVELRDFYEGVQVKRAMREPGKFESVMTEAMSTPTREWNIRRRLELLRSRTTDEMIAELVFAREHDGMTMKDAQRLAGEGDRALLQEYYQLRGQVGSEINVALIEINRLYKAGEYQAAFEKVDETIAGIAERTGLNQ